jgi:hypothetical protein
VADLPPKEKGIVAEFLMIAERGRSDQTSRKSHSFAPGVKNPGCFFVMRRAADGSKLPKQKAARRRPLTDHRADAEGKKQAAV